MFINTLWLSTLIIYSYKILFYVTSLIIYPKKLPICHHVVNKSVQGEEADFEINCVILWQIQIRVCTPIAIQQIQTVYWSVLTIVIGALWENSEHRKIRESLLGSAGLGRCTGLRNRCTF